MTILLRHGDVAHQGVKGIRGQALEASAALLAVTTEAPATPAAGYLGVGAAVALALACLAFRHREVRYGGD